MVSRLARFALAVVFLPAVALGQTLAVRVATFNIETMSGAGSQFDAARDILIRVGADVVCVQEMADDGAFADLAGAAGYDYHYLANPNGNVDLNADWAGVMSKYPFTNQYTATAALLSGDPSAKDITRNFVVAVVDVPGAAQDLVIIGNHWKASGDDVDEFRRSIESIRAMQASEDYDSAQVPYFVVGDMNDNLGSTPSPSSFAQSWYTTHQSEFPASYSLGSDIVFPVQNGTFKPFQAGTGSQALTVILARQKDGSYATMVESSSRYDYLWKSDAVALAGAEIYDSRDEGLSGGLPKYGSPLAYGTSDTASDHMLVFADVLIESATPLIGACCQTGGTCADDVVEADCETGGGYFYGNATACDDPPQPPCQGPGACCLPGGTCQEGETIFDCVGTNGHFYGEGSDCAGPLDPPCQQPGACCDPGGLCREDLNEAACGDIEGYFYGVGVSCLDPLDPPCIPIEVEAIINEVLASHDGTDDKEFLELTGTPYGTLEGLSVLVIEGQTLSRGAIDAIFDLTYQQIGGNGYFSLGDSGLPPDLVVGDTNIFENGSETFLLVKNLPTEIEPGVDVDTDNDGVADVYVGTVLDAVGLVGGSGYPTEYSIYFDAPEVGPQGGLFPAGAARIPDGLDTGAAGDWRYLSNMLDGSDGDHPITPGQPNCGRGDFDQDRDRDLNDFHFFQNCFTGSGGGPPATGCDEGDLDEDNDVDLDDLALLAGNLEGP